MVGTALREEGGGFRFALSALQWCEGDEREVCGTAAR